MGGEITKNEKEDSKTQRKHQSSIKNQKSQESIISSRNGENIQKNHHEHHKRKKEKIQIVAKNKKIQNEEKKNLEVIHKNNPNKEDYDLIYNIIDKHFFMQTLNAQARNEIIITMSLCRVKKNTTLFKQGSNGNYWYIVHEGQLEKIFDEKKTVILNKGDSFGELALIYDSPRDSTVKTITDCELWVLKREVFKKILDYLFTLNYEQNRKFLDSINLPLDNSFKAILANNLLTQIYKSGDIICKEGDLGNCMYIIQSGEVNCVKNNKIIRTLKKGDNFGQKAILEENRRTLDIIAKTDCHLCSISIEFFKHQLGDNYKEILYFGFLNLAFQNSKYFNIINTKMLETVFQFF